MADYCRVMVVWSLVGADSRVCTFDLIRTTPGTEGAAEAEFDEWWNALKIYSNNWVTLDQFRWYAKAGAAPAVGEDWGPAFRVIERDVPGTGQTAHVGVAGALLPPQCSVVVTELIGEGRIHRGRTYLPVGIGAMLTSDGHLDSQTCDLIATAYKNLHEGLIAAGFGPYVLAVAGGNRATYMIDGYRVNNTFDIQRRRGYEIPTYTAHEAVAPFV